MEVPIWIVYLAIPCGSFLMCFRFLQVCWRFYRTGQLPSHDHAQVDGVNVNADSPTADAGGKP
jgi:C4-dicarboxylate transporter DctQ subunit